MFIVVEGPNGTGKSTLCKQLAKKFNIDYIKLPIPKNGFKDYIKWSIKYDNCVMDRFHLGEIVYPSFKNDGRIPLTIWQQYMIERILFPKNGMLIYSNTNDLLKKDLFINKRKNEISFIDDIDKENLFFNECYLNSILPKTKYNYDIDNIITIENFIEKNYNDNNIKLQQYESIGNTYSNNIIFVGERYNDKTFIGNGNNRCFIDYKGSSIYLHRALSNTKYNNSYYFTNCIKYDDNFLNLSSLNDELQILNPKKIICLGKIAKKYISKLTKNYNSINHPQYFNRFKYNNIEEYTQIISKILEDTI